ncbi:LAQU0S11e02872g1_1 [Lachancea quebecensis]|uniref:sphinganine-1-phosphate aldolase n=1 Tax=Lachancea quebecensis TaxID=1654605 RepID=A0A0N7MM02_9SACH|nr:LAQU0S11e02872g1_1 [Lachancea quebecensis]
MARAILNGTESSKLPHWESWVSSAHEVLPKQLQENLPLFVLATLLIYKVISYIWYYVGGFGVKESTRMLRNRIGRPIFKFLTSSFILKSSVDREVEKSLSAMECSLMKDDAQLGKFDKLPSDGLEDQAVLEELDLSQKVLAHSDWEGGKVSGAVYHGGQELIHLQSQAFEKYCVANQLHPDVFPAVRKMESEVVSMILKMFNAPEDTGCGTTTSGGTESLLLACLSAKMYALRHKSISKPEIIVPLTAHAAFDKAAYYFGMKLRHAPLDPKSFKVDLKRVRRLINSNTVLIVGSAPNFPHGIVDDIEGLGELAERYQIPLHVDCCLGSFVIAFMEKAGFEDIPAFDFRVPGVTSISCDTHKYGFAPKGSSVIMYRNRELRMNQYYLLSDWVGGLYGSPTLAGSRPGALVVGCWATMLRMGEKGYINSCKEIISAARELKRFIRQKLPQVCVIGDPLCSVVSFTSDQIDVHELSDKLAKQGWHLSALQNPPALHLAVTRLTIPALPELMRTLQEVVNELSSDPNKKPSSDGTSALYGVAGSVKTSGVVDRLLVGFLDTLYKTKRDY